MSLLAKIKSEQLQARKNKNAVATALLTTLIGEASMVGKNNGNRESTDAEVTATIKKFIANTNETIELLIQRGADLGTLSQELALLKTFLPTQLEGAELESLIDDVIDGVGVATMKDMGNIIKTIKARTQGNCDMSVASALVKQKLSK